jgi:hypothetical protein
MTPVTPTDTEVHEKTTPGVLELNVTAVLAVPEQIVCVVVEKVVIGAGRIVS